MFRNTMYKITVVLGLLALGACGGGDNAAVPAGGGGTSDITAPIISNIAVTNINSTSATVSWTTNENATSQVEHGATTSYGSMISGPANMTSHSVTLSGLTPDTLHNYRVISTDAANNTSTSANATFRTAAAPGDTTVPIISSVVVTNITPTSATVTWTTNENSSTQVQYGTTPAYGSSTMGASNVMSHSVSLTGLSANTTYNFRVSSADAANNMASSANATFQSGSVDLSCTGAWAGSEETTNITAWPYRDCFRTDPVAGGRTRLSAGTGGAVVWEQGTGWNGQNALRVRPPDGSLGNYQGYAGLGEHSFHSIRTKRLNIRYLIRYNANWAQYAQRNKWEVAIKYDYSNPNAPVRLQGCERGIAEGRTDPLNGARENFVMQQGVCTQAYNVPNQNGWNFGPGVRENEWISVENEFDLETGWYRTYITTQDGVYNQSLLSEININTLTYGAPAETVPNPNWWGSIDCSAGCFWDYPADLGTVPRPVDTYIWYSHFVMSNNRIGPPTGFIR